jgi:hypothetical protein
MTTAREPIDELVHGFAHGRLTRREFIVRMLALGVSMGAIGPIIAACGGGSASSGPAGRTAAPFATGAPGGGKEVDSITIALTADIQGFDYVATTTEHEPVIRRCEALSGMPDGSLPGLADPEMSRTEDVRLQDPEGREVPRWNRATETPPTDEPHRPGVGRTRACTVSTRSRRPATTSSRSP